jgi:uncharacterized protein YcfJ
MTMTVPARAEPRDAAATRRSNRRIALTLGSIALVFFGGIIATQLLGGNGTGLTVLGAAVLLFLVLAIGRNLRDK